MRYKGIQFLFVLLSSWVFGQTEALQNHLDSDFYKTQFVGFYLYDPQEKKEVFSYNGNKYFTPASNTKIFTLYAAMKTLTDSIPAFKYAIRGDELHLEGTGDPTFMHPKFKNPKVLDFIKNKGSKIVFHWNNFDEESFLPGWTWDDFRKKYSPERSQFPINENLVTISKSGGTLKTFPSIFKESTVVKESSESRDFYENKFYIGLRSNSVKVPFIVKEDVIKQIITDLTGKPVEMTKSSMPSPSLVFYSQTSDKVYKEMMEESDNFLAEHLLILSSSTMNGKLSTTQTIKTISSRYLSDLAQRPEWVDGSGLSRYNLFTPQNFVQVLDKMYKEFPENRLFSIFPVGGRTGTIKNRYKDSSQPYVYAKTGTLSNTVTLSGYLKTKSGKTLIFSLLNNNVTKDLSWVRNENEKLLRLVRDQF
ncbi:D-alanyl-D-alanine carboxypeptidase/D-alanyl-D-alanine-endopeptidase [Faecalibacter sp. LW9]|uniref:D-alanyl-D-alanine carboxypeptidase/D-alanyl-D-alanine-endopeptidase n=1 Tax=Faecalibacter sp. LW9 TaxID=3103144 RepID=UPI002AFE3EED|nr:D-alanyl-D-alanine carboxypeptidase [Faecalibacter sp. LW9]